MYAFYRRGFALPMLALSVSSVSAREPDEVLLEETRLDFIQTPLIQVLAFLSEMHRVQITVDVTTERQREHLADNPGTSCCGSSPQI